MKEEITNTNTKSFVRDKIRKAAVCLIRTYGYCAIVYLYSPDKSSVSFRFEEEPRAEKFYNICLRYMAKHNHHIKHDLHHDFYGDRFFSV